MKEEDIYKTGVYAIRNTINNKQYIGSTTMTFQKRWNHHKSRLNANKHKNSYLQNAWNKYGKDSFVFEILEICSKENCFVKEQIYLDRINTLYNINPIASGTPNLSQETIKKRTESLKRYWKINGTDKLKGKIPWNKGLHCTDKMKKNMSESAKKRKLTKQGRIKRQLAFDKKANSVLQFDKNNNFIKEWNSIREISNTMPNYLQQGIRSCCNGHYKCGYYKDFVFKYKNTALLNSNIQIESDEFEESLSQNNDKVTTSLAFNTLKEGVTTTGAVQSA